MPLLFLLPKTSCCIFCNNHEMRRFKRFPCRKVQSHKKCRRMALRAIPGAYKAILTAVVMSH